MVSRFLGWLNGWLVSLDPSAEKRATFFCFGFVTTGYSGFQATGSLGRVHLLVQDGQDDQGTF